MTRRVVLATNIVLSALIFTADRLAWIRHAWQRRQLQPLVCKETVHELLQVLACPKFKLFSHVGEADALVAGDADILVMRETFAGLIVTAEELAQRPR